MSVNAFVKVITDCGVGVRSDVEVEVVGLLLVVSEAGVASDGIKYSDDPSTPFA